MDTEFRDSASRLLDKKFLFQGGGGNICRLRVSQELSEMIEKSIVTAQLNLNWNF